MEKDTNNAQTVVGFAQFDGLRVEYEDRLETQRKELLEDKHKTVKGWQKAFFSVSIVLILFISGVIGIISYLLYTYDFSTYSYNQDIIGDGYNNISGNRG